MTVVHMSSTGSARSLQFVGITYQVPPLKAPQHVHCRCPGAALRNPAVVLQRRRLRSTGLIRTAAKKKIAVEDPPVVAANIRQDLLPELIVFDLDNTVWTPELYQLRKAPKAWKNIHLFDGAAEALTELATSDAWRGSKVAAASRANAVSWAHNLLGEFAVGVKGEETTLARLFSVAEVYPGNKKKHFAQIRKRTGVAYERMIFFDDYIGNCQDVAELGVMCVKVGNGLNRETWELAVRVFAGRCAAGAYMGGTFSEKGLRLEWNAMDDKILAPPNNETGNNSDAVIPTAPPSATTTTSSSNSSPPSGRAAGAVKWYSAEKGYGFLAMDGGGADIYLSDAQLRVASIDDAAVTQGTRLTFETEAGPGGKGERAAKVELEEGEGGEVVVKRAGAGVSVRLPCLSMRQPFAALLLNGAKTLESRGSDMLAGYEGQRVALHVGTKQWEGPEAYGELLEERGLSEREIKALCQLPPRAKRGTVVALLTLGKTYQPTAKQRSEEEVRQGVLATEQGIGRYVTEVKNVALLREAVRMPGQPGVWHCSLPEQVLP